MNPWMIGDNLYSLICETIPHGAVILELGSGEGTGKLAKYYTMHSIEHDPTFVDKYDSHYIYAPLKDGWYCRPMVEAQLPDRYDALLIDGPPGELRIGILNHLDLFDLSVPIFVDDINRQAENIVFCAILEKCGHERSFDISHESDGRSFVHINAT